MKGKNQKGKAQRTVSVAVPEMPSEFKNSETTYQIMGNTGGDYIKTKLPSDFFESVMFGEMSLEYDFSIEGLTKLMDLYSLGIQYFLENNPIQAKHFQDRMGYILTNKDTLSNLKKQQDKEEKEKKEKDKNIVKDNKENKKEEKKEYPKSCKTLPKVTRQRAKTNFMFKAQTIQKEDIKKKVTFVLDDTNKIKQDKENVKSIIKEDLNQQNLQWKEKLKKKRENFNANFGFTRPRNRTTFITKKKTFQTPGPSTNRSVMTLNSPSTKSPSQDNFGFGMKEKSNMKESKTSGKKYNNIDQENSEIDDLEKNEGDIEFLKQLKERHKNDEDGKEEEEKKEKNKDDDDSDSNSDSDSDSEDDDKKRKNSDEYLNKIDEVEEEKEPSSLRQTARTGELNKKKDKDNNNIDNEQIKSDDNNKNNDGNNKDNKDDNKTEENKDNKNNNEENKDNKDDNNNREVKEKENNENSFSTQTTEIKNDIAPPSKKRASIVDEKNLVREIDLDDVIVEAVDQKMKRIEDLNKPNDANNNNNEKGDDEASEGQTDEISSISNTHTNPIQDLRLTIDEIPLKFQETYTEVEIEMNRYVKDLNNHFYKDTFEIFSLELKELYDKKYKKYVEVNNEYHASITENEYQLENDNKLSEEQKLEIQNIIDSLKEEQKDQIDKITDEYNQMIDSKIRDFKQTFFQKDCGFNLMEEQLKLDIYTMINEAFY